MTFKDVKEGDVVYYIREWSNIRKKDIVKTKVNRVLFKDGYKYICYAYTYAMIPFNHLSASRIKVNGGDMLFLSQRAFRKYCQKQVEQLIVSNDVK